MLPIHTILCPLDFSEPSYKALQVAIEIGSHFEAELVLCHVVPDAPAMPVDAPYAFAGEAEYEQVAKDSAEKELVIAAKRLPGEIKSRTAIGMGDAADEIVRLAENEAADLIVIATHGLTGWRHLVFGSVAEKVIRLSDRPVLVVPAHEPKV
jgi:nucleotide-binding universal stress UspA family protein